ncbi:hypothetical protein LTR36_005899 [Oleoguttula mirabilis]|uniref:Small ribosomal subunit protein uS10m n=1 Tax=Oleoguttula mirabilis TaxID=1507867 RepID=A0AAV9JDB9_9PEZI|nr:hypothetical protein LTR36_005899 [Oleoguttula mirabilis]
MATPSYARSALCLGKRLKLSPPPNPAIQCQTRGLRQRATPAHALAGTSPSQHVQKRHESTQSAVEEAQPSPPIDAATAAKELQRIRLPRAVQATYLDPLRRPSRYHVKTCELQLRSYSIRNLEVFADFAMRAAYYLKLPASGPRPLPKITERWTVPRSSFVHKKSQENFERITVRRQIEINDGHPETVAVWLGFLKKHQYYGIGMKANVFEYGGLEVAQDMDAEAEAIAEKLGETLDLVGGKRSLMNSEEEVQGMVESEPFKAAWGAHAAMSGAQSVPHAHKRIASHVVE